MAQPTEYERQFDFTDFSTSSPTAQQPGVQIDAEFNAVKETLDETLTNLALIQRDDGALANVSVGRDQLKAEVVQGVNTPADWLTATSYTVRDSVIINAKWYWALEAHTSGVFATDLGAGKWQLILDLAPYTTAAAASATAAASSATAAAASASAASTSASAASTSASAASTSATAAAASASAASTSAASAATQATNAATSATAAAASATTAATQATNAATSASAASTSASAASTSATAAAASAATASTAATSATASASAAATSASAASTSATAAAASAATASTQATNAATSASAASTSASAASTSASAASTSATAAAASATAAATSETNAAASAAAAGAYTYTYSTTLTAADPGAGKIRFNNATLSSVTAMYISETNGDANDVSADIATWDDGTSTVRGRLWVVKAANPAVFASYNVTGTNTDGGAWDTVNLAYVAGAGSLSNNDPVRVRFVPKGDKGDAGAGTGDMLAAVYDAAGIAQQLLGTTAAQTVTNKTIVAGSNTITGITLAMMAANVADTDTSLTANSDTRVATQKAIKAYVDSFAAGLTIKNSCRAATTANLVATYANGSSGVGATLTLISVGALAFDGITVAVADRILVKNQSTTYQNGIYTVTATGSGIAVGVLTRVGDYDQPAEVQEGDYTLVSAGTTQAATGWVETGAGPFTIGTTAITFTQFNSGVAYTAGTGLQLVGSAFSIDSTVATLAGSQTLTNKSIVATQLTGTLAAGQFPALTGDITTSAGSLVTAIGAGKVTEAMQVLADNTTNDASTSKHGYMKKLPNTAATYYDGTGAFSVPAANDLLRNSVRAASITNGTLASAFENGDTLDGVTLATGDRILLKNQTDLTENGPYVVAASGAPTRAADADAGSEIAKCVVFVREGTINAGTTWQNNQTSITVGATNITFSFHAGAPNISPGTNKVLAIGPGATATGGDGSTAIGYGASAAGSGIALGISASCASNGVVIGESASAADSLGVAIGYSASAAQVGGVAIGGGAAAATNTYSTAVGRLANATGANSIALGGGTTGPQATAANAVAIGDLSVSAFADAVALGRYSKTRNTGSSVFAAGRFAVAGDAQLGFHLLRGTTTDATPAEILCSGAASSRISLPSDSTFFFRARVVARRTDADNESAAYVFTGCIDNNAGTTALVGGVMTDYVNEDTAGLAVAFTADNTNDALVCTVTGIAAKTFNWVAFVETVEVVG